jgi:outer membrane protein OmpA-like peptidoglycan-associated protein
MRLTSSLAVAAVLGLAALSAAQAQTVANFQEVQVTPVRPGGGVLLYPGGEYSRVVPSLLYPGESSAPISLHMPGPHRRSLTRNLTRSAPRAKPASPRMAVAKPPPPPKPAPAKPAPRLASAAPAPQQTPSANYNPFGGAPDLSHALTGGAPQQNAPSGGPGDLAHALTGAPPPKPTPPPKPKPAPPPQRTASANPIPDLSHALTGPPPAPQPTAPAGPTNGNENLTKRSVILFAKDAPDPAKQALGALKFLAGDLNTAMVSPNARIELQAFGGAKGDKSSDAHRLSLKRALSIRQVLIDDGVSADRIDVRAMGGVDDTGPTDRVDVYVKA